MVEAAVEQEAEAAADDDDGLAAAAAAAAMSRVCRNAPTGITSHRFKPSNKRFVVFLVVATLFLFFLVSLPVSLPLSPHVAVSLSIAIYISDEGSESWKKEASNTSSSPIAGAIVGSTSSKSMGDMHIEMSSCPVVSRDDD